MKTHFLSYGDGNYTKRKHIICEQVRASNLDPKIDYCYAWDRSFIPGFYGQYEHIMDTLPCSGRFIWKPYIILKLLRNVAENDIVIYCDSGSEVINRGEYKEQREERWRYYFEALDHTECPMIGFAPIDVDRDNAYYYTNIESKHTVDLLERFGLNTPEFLYGAGMEAGFLMARNTAKVREAVKFWLDLMTENDCELTKTAHSADQGLFNIMFELFGGNKLIWLDGYGSGPFFFARMTDQGQKPGWNQAII